MIDSSTGYTKGYAFVTYCDKENARQAANKVSKSYFNIYK